jgi:hypothetical protein
MTTAQPLQPLTPDEEAVVRALPRVTYVLVPHGNRTVALTCSHAGWSMRPRTR